MNRALLEEKLAELPLYIYDFLDPKELEFTPRIRTKSAPCSPGTWPTPGTPGTSPRPGTM